MILAPSIDSLSGSHFVGLVTKMNRKNVLRIIQSASVEVPRHNFIVCCKENTHLNGKIVIDNENQLHIEAEPNVVFPSNPVEMFAFDGKYVLIFNID